MAVHEQLYDRYLSDHYGALNDFSDAGDRAAIESYRRLWAGHLPADRTAPCVDVGAGTGRFVQFLVEEGFTAAEGVDLSPENAEAAAAKGRRVVVADGATHLRGLDGLGLVSIIDVLEHLPKEPMLALLAAARDALGPGGRLFVKTVNAANILGLYGRYMDLTHELAFTAESLRQATTQAGFARMDVVSEPAWRGRDRVRAGLGAAVHWFLYRAVEGRPVPACTAFDITVVAHR